MIKKGKVEIIAESNSNRNKLQNKSKKIREI